MPTYLIEGSTSSSNPTAQSPSSEEKDEALKSDPLVLKELDDDRKSRVSKKAASSSSVSSSTASFLSLSSSDPLALASGSKSK